MEIENNITKNMSLRVFLSLRTKTLKHIQNTYYKDTEQHSEKPVFYALKRMNCTLYVDTDQNITKTLPQHY